MSEMINQIEDLNNKNKKALDELFGLFGDKNKESESDNSNIIVQTGPLSFELNGNKIETSRGASSEEWESYDWINGKLSWLAKAKFECYYIEVDFKEEKLKKFGGKWYGGDFLEGNFISYKGEEAFLGGTFRGNYQGKWDSWKVHPVNFIDGTWLDSKNGILGMSNLTDLTIDRSGNSADRDINLIRVPVGSSIEINTLDNTSFIVTVTGRLNSASSNFSYSVYDKQTGKRTNHNFTWVQIRNGGESGFLSNTLISLNNPKSFQIFGIDTGRGINSIQIKPSESFKKESPAGHVGDSTSLNFSTIEKSPIKLNLNLNLRFPIKGDNLEFEKVLNNIKSGVLASDLEIIKRGIASCDIDGYHGYKALAPLFGKVKGERDMEDLEQRQLDALSRTQAFFVYLVNNLYNKKGEINEQYQNRVIRSLQDYIQLQNINLCLPGGKKIPTKPKTKKVPTTSKSKSRKRGFTGSVPKPTNESLIRKEISRIISENF